MTLRGRIREDALLATEQPQDSQTVLAVLAVCFDGTDRLRQPWLCSMHDCRAQE